VQVDVAKAQADTLREWAAIWERGAEPSEGAIEVAFLLKRAATQIARVSGVPQPEPDPLPANDAALVGALRE
jgi:hypothetical protein